MSQKPPNKNPQKPEPDDNDNISLNLDDLLDLLAAESGWECPECGGRIDVDEQVCPKCGHKLDNTKSDS